MEQLCLHHTRIQGDTICFLRWPDKVSRLSCLSMMKQMPPVLTMFFEGVVVLHNVEARWWKGGNFPINLHFYACQNFLMNVILAGKLRTRR